MPIRTCVVGGSKSLFSAATRGSPPDSPSIFSAMEPPNASSWRARATRASCADLQERRIARELAEIDLPPRRAVALRPAPHVPRGLFGVVFHRRQLREIAQAEHALDDDAGTLFAGARAQQQKAREIAENDGREPQELRKVDDAEQVAADVREAEKPGLRKRNRDDRRHGNHFARVGEADQPALVAAWKAEAAR